MWKPAKSAITVIITVIIIVIIIITVIIIDIQHDACVASSQLQNFDCSRARPAMMMRVTRGVRRRSGLPPLCPHRFCLLRSSVGSASASTSSGSLLSNRERRRTGAFSSFSSSALPGGGGGAAAVVAPLWALTDDAEAFRLMREKRRRDHQGRENNRRRRELLQEQRDGTDNDAALLDSAADFEAQLGLLVGDAVAADAGGQRAGVFEEIVWLGGTAGGKSEQIAAAVAAVAQVVERVVQADDALDSGRSSVVLDGLHAAIFLSLECLHRGTGDVVTTEASVAGCVRAVDRILAAADHYSIPVPVDNWNGCAALRAASGDIEGAFSAIQEILDLGASPTQKTAEAVVSAVVADSARTRASNFSPATVELICTTVRGGGLFPPSLITDVMTRLAASASADLAEQMAASITDSGLELAEETLDEFIVVMAQAGRTQRARELLDESQARSDDSVINSARFARAYNAVAASQFYHGELDAAQLTLSRMRDANVLPTVDTYAEMWKAQCRDVARRNVIEEEGEEALAVAESLAEKLWKGRQMWTSVEEVERLVRHFNDLLREFLVARDYRAAEWIASHPLPRNYCSVWLLQRLFSPFNLDAGSQEVADSADLEPFAALRALEGSLVSRISEEPSRSRDSVKDIVRVLVDIARVSGTTQVGKAVDERVGVDDVILRVAQAAVDAGAHLTAPNFVNPILRALEKSYPPNADAALRIFRATNEPGSPLSRDMWSFNAVASVLARIGDDKNAKDLLEEMLKLFEAGELKSPSWELFVRVGRAFRECSKLNEILSLLDRMESLAESFSGSNPTTKLHQSPYHGLGLLMVVAASAVDGPEGVEAFQALVQRVFNVHDRLLKRASGKELSTPEAIDLEAFVSRISRVLGTVLHGVAPVGNIDMMEGLVTEMHERSVPISMDHFNALIRAHADLGALDNAEAVLDDAYSRQSDMRIVVTKDSQRRFHEYGPLSFQPILDGYAKRGDVDQVHRLFEKMETNGVVPDAGSRVSLVRAMSVAETGAGVATSFAGLAANASAAAPDGVNRIGSTLESSMLFLPRRGFEHVVTGFGSDASAAHEAFSEMRLAGFPPTVGAFDALMQVYERAHDPQGVLQVLEEAIDAGVALGVLTERALSCLAARGRVDDIRVLVDRMQGTDTVPSPSVYIWLLRACTRAKLVDEAREIFAEARESGAFLTRQVFNTYLMCLAFCDDISEVDRVFSELEVRFEPNEQSYAALIAANLAADDLRGVSRVFHLMEGAGIEKTELTLNIVLEWHASRGDSESARALMEKMIDRGIAPDVKSYNTLIEALTRKGDLSSALDVLEEMRERDIAPNWATFRFLHEAAPRDLRAQVESLAILAGFKAQAVRQGRATSFMGGFEPPKKLWKKAVFG